MRRRRHLAPSIECESEFHPALFESSGEIDHHLKVINKSARPCTVIVKLEPREAPDVAYLQSPDGDGSTRFEVEFHNSLTIEEPPFRIRRIKHSSASGGCSDHTIDQSVSWSGLDKLGSSQLPKCSEQYIVRCR